MVGIIVSKDLVEAVTWSQKHSQFDYIFSCLKEMEGFIAKEHNGFALFGLNSKFNPEVVQLIRTVPQNLDSRSYLEKKVRTIYLTKYWPKSQFKGIPSLHFLFNNVWTCPYTRSINLLRLHELITLKPDILALRCANKYISYRGVRRRIRIYNDFFS